MPKDRTKYAYAVGRIRSLETKLLDADLMERMLETADVSGFLQILKETNYGSSLSEKNLDRLLEVDILETKELLNKLGIERKLTEAFCYRWDFSVLKEIADDYDNPWLKRLAVILIDFANLRTWIRLKKLDESKELLESQLISGGTLDSKMLLRWFGESIEILVNRLRFGAYAKVVQGGVESTAALEKLMDDYLINYVKSARFMAFGIEPLIAYFIAKQIEAWNIHFLLVAKSNHISNKLIKERMRKSYI